ncbi:response regulator [Maridesulfovibrio sp.]|uniref:response regulator n=1 Tax=Maridesulfovibrio sp. TaxID=2795000 RepID=UPI0029F54211|nr:response regulator [Maridesulfovibrio sp.]
MPVYPNNIPTILIVDDEPFNLEFLEIVLRQQGYNILTATNGRSGRDLAEQAQPDLILLDIMMPDETGFECATVLRLSPETAEIPIIFLSALDDESNTSRGYDTGAVDFIVKPFVYKDVINRIRLHLKLNICDKSKEGQVKGTTPPPTEKPYPKKGARYIFHSRSAPCDSVVHEAVVMDAENEGHLLLNFQKACTAEIRQQIKLILADNSGPLFRPSETLRNIGIQLKALNMLKSVFSACYLHIDRELDNLTVVNAGALPLVFMNKKGTHFLIERQSGNLGSLGRGLLPCSSYDIDPQDRIFMVSRSMLGSFGTEGEGIRELLESCHRHLESELETTCRNVGQDISCNGEADGILLGIEM